MAAILCASWPTAGAAQASSNTETLSNVVVTATRQLNRVDANTAEITVIDRAAIERADGRTLTELLAQQPGLQLSANGGLGKNSSLYVRGLDARHVLLLVDGVRQGSATAGTPSFDNLPLASIERIEIVRGPLSGLYGSDAVGGVVQVFTRRGADGVQPHAKVAAGSNHYAEAGGGVRFGAGAWSGAVQGQHVETRGFSATSARARFGNHDPDRDGFRQDSGSAQLTYGFTPDWRLTTRVLHADGLTQVDDGAGTDARARLKTQVLSAELAGRPAEGWRSTLRASRARDGYDTLASASAFTDLGEIATVQRQVSWENSVATPLGSMLLLAEHLRQNVAKPGSAYAVSARTVNAVALGLDGGAGAHGWQASLRHDRNSQYGTQNTGSLGYGIEFAEGWRAAATAGTSFVAPSFNQLYWPDFGNPDLQPEEGKHAELSLRWSGAGHSVRAAWFDNRIRSYIASGETPTNIPKARIDGITLAYQGRLGATAVSASLDHLDARSVQGDNAGRALPRRARNAARLAADRTIDRVDLGATMVAFGERYDDARNERRLPGYATLDLRADWRIATEWALGARLNNVADKAYETVHGYNQPGRGLYVSLRYAPKAK
ncbi:TonB-dependent receptor domain-containing protein [Piscinibacter sp.]|uniref:TonB-dependent receptor domain-containing protein n=1 Tax=Piscinibacter sp. TaxID=1903157 RepID=UPI002B65DACD|nr:TonB-dependent receptor [Albitalea sp.]HUG25647.1 TonB-dependent receptor [Albitalea sp.]